MELIKEIIVNNYIIITVVACILVLSLIGYLAENQKQTKNASENIKPIPDKIEDTKTEDKPKIETHVAMTSNSTETKEQPVEEPLFQEEIEDDNGAPNLGLEE